jgi:hypothetical protein
MFAPLFSLLSTLRSCFRTRAALHAEILALRHQLLVLQRSSREHRLRLHVWDRAFLGLAFSAVVRLVFRLAYCETRNGDCLASERISALLDMEEPCAKRSAWGS